MKKYFLMLAMLAAAPFAFGGETAVTIAFGKDGAFEKSFPNANSESDARAIYEALDGRTGNSPIKVDGKNFGFEATVESFWMGFEMGSHDVQISKSNNQNGSDVAFSGPAAETLFAALKLKPLQTTGATMKRVGNLTCGRAVTAKPVVKCTITGATVLKVPM